MPPLGMQDSSTIDCIDYVVYTIYGSTVDFQLVVQKLRREFAHAQNFLFKIKAKVRACADSRRDFWTTNWKSTVQGFSGPLSQKSDENPRMRVIPHSKFPPKCVHAPILVAFFVTTDLKNPVQRFAGFLHQTIMKRHAHAC